MNLSLTKKQAGSLQENISASMGAIKNMLESSNDDIFNELAEEKYKELQSIHKKLEALNK